MQIVKISPRGFCSGVVNAWKIVVETTKNFPHSRIFMLGLFVHNKKMIEEIKTPNLFVLDDSKTSRYELVYSLDFQPGDILIMSAHGTDDKTVRLAKEKGFKIVDTTCKYVYNTHAVIRDALKNNKIVIYLGIKNHPESLAATAIDKNIIFVSNENELRNLNYLFDKPILVTNQTTLSVYDLKNYYDFIKTHFKNYELRNDLCTATQERQEALINLKTKLNVLIVVGDEKSNNSQQLLKIGYYKKIERCYLINDVEQLKTIHFNHDDVIGVTSGASTPTKVTNEIIKYLEELN